MRVIDRIRVPALILTAEDDPFVPPEPFRDPAVAGNPHVTTVVTRARRPLRLRRARRRRRLRRLLGGARDRQVRAAQLADVTAEVLPSAACAELRALPCLFVLEVDEDVARSLTSARG